ncbi:MAG: exonuclease subunit SbcD [Bacteroidales bacterium]|nr:exonuclease subunit SbcD [Bacteroidales bacterium]
MKILHTSDWHIGQIFNFHYDRQEEHQFFIDELKKIVSSEQPDVFLLCGDVYDKGTPSSASMRFFSDNLFEIVEANPGTVFVITAGNHDSGVRIEVDQEVWKRHNTYFVGSVERDGDNYLFDKHIIEVKDKGFIAAVPYLQSYYNDFYNLVLAEIEGRNTAALPVVLMGHTTIGNSIFDSHEHTTINGRISVGGIDSVGLGEIDDKYDYFALGHIHTPQTLSNGKARYCGSPVQMNFKESYRHSVSIVEMASRGAKPMIREVPLTASKNFYTIPYKPKPLDEALTVLGDNLPEEAGYVQLNILTDGFVPADTENRIRNILKKNDKLLYCDFKTTRVSEKDAATEFVPDFGLSEFKSQEPVDIARQYYAETQNASLDESLVELLKSVVDEVRNGANE